MIVKKIWFIETTEQNIALAERFLTLLEKSNLDYTRSYSFLTYKQSYQALEENLDFKEWCTEWERYIMKYSTLSESQKIMTQTNPIIIPRNHFMEEALDKAVTWDIDFYNNLLKVLQKPYEYNTHTLKYVDPTEKNYDMNYKTYCGT